MDIKVIASGSSGNAYRISDGATTLLLDAGIPYERLQIALDFKICALNGCLVTHEHQDHARAVKNLLKNGVKVYTSNGTKTVLGASCGRVAGCEPLKQFDIGTFTVLPFPVEHDAEEPFGFLIYSKKTGEKLLYATDTFYIRFSFAGLTHIMVECNHSIQGITEDVSNGLLAHEQAERLMRSHMAIERLEKFLQETDLQKVRKIYLLHLSKRNADGELFGNRVRALTGKEVVVC